MCDVSRVCIWLYVIMYYGLCKWKKGDGSCRFGRVLWTRVTWELVPGGSPGVLGGGGPRVERQCFPAQLLLVPLCFFLVCFSGVSFGVAMESSWISRLHAAIRQ